MSTTDHSTDAALFEHVALVYRTEGDYVAGIAPFVRTALAQGGPILVAVPPHNLDLLRTALGEDARRVDFLDMTVAGRNPSLMHSTLLDFVNAHPGQRVFAVGEPVWPGRTDVEYPACVTHEALVNTVFAGCDAAFLCPYDARRLDARVIADARRSHPLLEQRGVRRSSDAYTDPLTLADEFNQPLSPPPADAAVLDYAGRDALPEARRFAAKQAEAAGLAEERIAELAVAVNELVANTVEHTAVGGGRITVWTESDVFVCHVEDTGHLPDPLVGRLMPDITQPRGRGLVFVNRLCDLVRVHSRPGRTEFRLHFRL